MGLDFSQLYSLLGLEPGCSLEELKHAYRKRVAELHPDRHSPKSRDDERSIRLAKLIPLYKDAIHFHELHGRLPGSTTVETSAVRQGSAASRGQASSQAFLRRRGAAPETSPIPASHWWLLLGLACLIGYLVFSAFSGQGPARGSSATVGTHPPGAHAGMTSHDDHAYVLAGMDADTILAIQGPPSRVSGDVWEYGPSWLRFKDGRLVEWHSSPLYRLRTRTPRSPAEQ